MKSLPSLHVRGAAPTTCGERHAYLVAARHVLCDAALAPLETFAVPSAGAPSAPALSVPAGRESPVHRGEAWVGGRFVEVACARVGDAYVLRAAGLPAVAVRRAGCAVAAASPGAVPAALDEVLVGPGLILALALDGVFALHAAAVVVDGAAVLLAGASGAGKSTLARALAEAGADRVADDVLPCEAAPSGAQALPHYPQLKLRAAEQYALARPPRVPLRAIYELHGSEKDAGPTLVEPVGRRDAAVLLAAHTVAARLFDAPLLERHLEFCAAVAGSVPVRTLRFTRRLKYLPAMVAALRTDLAAGR